jgi:hypothetical protein
VTASGPRQPLAEGVQFGATALGNALSRYGSRVAGLRVARPSDRGQQLEAAPPEPRVLEAALHLIAALRVAPPVVGVLGDRVERAPLGAGRLAARVARLPSPRRRLRWLAESLLDGELAEQRFAPALNSRPAARARARGLPGGRAAGSRPAQRCSRLQQGLRARGRPTYGRTAGVQRWLAPFQP